MLDYVIDSSGLGPGSLIELVQADKKQAFYILRINPEQETIELKQGIYEENAKPDRILNYKEIQSFLASSSTIINLKLKEGRL